MSKVLRVEPTPDGNGFFFSLSISDKGNSSKSSLSIPVSIGEFGVLKSLFNYSLPHLLGFDEVFTCAPFFQPMDSDASNGGRSSFGAANPAMVAGSAVAGSAGPPPPAEAVGGGDYWQQYGQQLGVPAAVGVEEGENDPAGIADEFFDENFREEEEEPRWEPSPDSANYVPGSGENAFGKSPPF
mmetsp:Transcript_37764/g.67684  ORF Transcript_37764/g.67684 Transcript_37764/m.67684 type:complete len:184 (-) Transcript_37764:102-653(-)